MSRHHKARPPVGYAANLRFAMESLRAIRKQHLMGLLHCDIKPDNMLVSSKPNSQKMYLKDSRFERVYADYTEDGKFVKKRVAVEREPKRKTLLYCSITFHSRTKLPSRVDDLFSWLFMMTHFVHPLPWANIENEANVLKVKRLTMHCYFYDMNPFIATVYSPIYKMIRSYSPSSIPEYSIMFSILHHFLCRQNEPFQEFTRDPGYIDKVIIEMGARFPNQRPPTVCRQQLEELNKRNVKYVKKMLNLDDNSENDEEWSRSIYVMTDGHEETAGEDELSSFSPSSSSLFTLSFSSSSDESNEEEEESSLLEEEADTEQHEPREEEEPEEEQEESDLIFTRFFRYY